jgi:hypothetical protein
MLAFFHKYFKFSVKFSEKKFNTKLKIFLFTLVI